MYLLSWLQGQFLRLKGGGKYDDTGNHMRMHPFKRTGVCTRSCLHAVCNLKHVRWCTTNTNARCCVVHVEEYKHVFQHACMCMV